MYFSINQLKDSIQNFNIESSKLIISKDNFGIDKLVDESSKTTSKIYN